MQALSEFKRRFCRRVINDLPLDLELIDGEDLMAFLRRGLPALLAKLPMFQDRRQAHSQPAYHSIPAAPRTSRQVSPEGFRSFHFAKNEKAGRSAGEFDGYATEKRSSDPEPAVGSVVETANGLSGAGREGYALSHGGENGAPPDHITNLSPQANKRPRQWSTIEDHERAQRKNPAGKPPGISFFYDRAPDFFDDVAKRPDCPSGFAQQIRKEQKRSVAGKPPSLRKEGDGVRWEDESAFQVYGWLKAQPGWPAEANKEEQVARVTKGRPVQTSISGDGEYPASLGKAARTRIREGLFAFAQQQRNPESHNGDGWFLPMTIADHVPDGLNDARNDHFHWLMGTRRARFTPGGELEFEDKKVNAITRSGWLDEMRGELARLSNIELAAAAAPYRLHPGTLEEMGCVDATAQKKVGARATVLERAGIPTSVGIPNTLIGWDRRFAEAERAYAAEVEAIRCCVPIGRDPDPRSLQAAGLRHEAAEIEIMVEMTRSRPGQTAEFAPEYAAAAKSKKAAQGWAAKGREAERHLMDLHRELAPERAGIQDRLLKADALDREVARSRQVGSDLLRTGQRRAEQVDVNRAIDIIAKTPLLLTERDGKLIVDPVDDPAGLVAGVDLRSEAVRARLTALGTSQRKQLAQVQAFARRHGAEALFDDESPDHSDWMRNAISSWRGTPAMQRWLGEREAALASLRRPGVSAGKQARSTAELSDLNSVPTLDSLRSLDQVDGFVRSTERAYSDWTMVLKHALSGPLPDYPNYSEFRSALRAIERCPIRLVHYDGAYRSDPRDDPDRWLESPYMRHPEVQQRLESILKVRTSMPRALAEWRRDHPGERPNNEFLLEQERIWDVLTADGQPDRPSVTADCAAQWTKNGLAAFASDVTTFPYILARDEAAEPTGSRPLVEALGPNAGWLKDAGVRGRLRACQLYQEATRHDILHDRLSAAGVIPGPPRSGLAASPRDVARHAGDHELEEQFRFLQAGGAKYERRKVENRLFHATIAAMNAGVPGDAVRLLADAARAQDNYLMLRMELPEREEHRIYTASSSPKRGISFKLPNRRSRRPPGPGRSLS